MIETLNHFHDLWRQNQSSGTDAQLAKVEAQVGAHPLPDLRDFPKPVSPRHLARWLAVEFESLHELKQTTCRRWRFVQRFWHILYVLTVACAQHRTGCIFGTSDLRRIVGDTILRCSLWELALFYLGTGYVEDMNGACYPYPCIFMHWLLALNSNSSYRSLKWITLNAYTIDPGRTQQRPLSELSFMAWSYSTRRPPKSEFHHSHYSVWTIEHIPLLII